MISKMHEEINRLETFNDWPVDVPVCPQRIAKAGFFYTKNNLTVECHFCKLQISEWDYGNQVMALHRRLSPQCPFVIDPATSGNVPIIPTSSNASSSLPPPDLTDEMVRLSTFTEWPVSDIVSPESLAQAGFYYLFEGDNTKCVYCGGVVRAWEPGDDPDREHIRHFPQCSFVINTILPRLHQAEMNDGQVDAEALTNLNLVAGDNLDELGIQAHKGPKRPNYATAESRIRTFINWPTDLIQTPDILSQAGFYYEGLGDQVRCFHCDGGLRHWDPHDDPWTEHARWFPRCSYVKLVKGQEFVNACSRAQNSDTSLEVPQKRNQGVSVNIRRREIHERDLQEYMTSPAAIAALRIGLNVEWVKRAIKEKLEQTGRSYLEPDALVEAALNIQREEEDTEGDNSQVVATALLHKLKSKKAKVVEKAKADTKPKVDKKEAVSLEEENRMLKEARLCKICMDGEVGIVFLPCGHLTTCVNCAPNLEECPLCRSTIRATVRIYLS